MRIAVAVDDARDLDSRMAFHFGRCPYYVFVDIEGDEIKKVETLPNPYFENHAPGKVPAFIHEHNVDVMITGGMGRRAIALFQEYGIQAYTGAEGTARAALEQFHGGALIDAQPCAHEHGESGHHAHGHTPCED